MFDNARWDDVPLRPDDILVATPAKTGTTWLQTICVMLVLGTMQPQPPDRKHWFRGHLGNRGS